MACRMEKKEFIGENNPNFKNGRNKKYCINCGIAISYNSKGRCYSCFNKTNKGKNQCLLKKYLY